MSVITLPTSTAPVNPNTVQFAQTAEVIAAGQPVAFNSSNKLEVANSRNSDRRQAVGFAVGSAPAAGQWVAYAPNGSEVTVSGLSAGESYVLAAGTNEQQSVDITGTPTGGTFRLSFGGVETADIAFDANAAAVQSALEAVSTIGSGNVAVTGSNPTFTVEFQGALGGEPQALLVLADNSLTGGTSPTVSISEDVNGDVEGSVALYADLASGDHVVFVLHAKSATQAKVAIYDSGATV